MENFTYYISIWLATAIPIWVWAWYVGKKFDDISNALENMKHVTACGKPVKKKKVIRANDK